MYSWVLIARIYSLLAGTPALSGDAPDSRLPASTLGLGLGLPDSEFARSLRGSKTPYDSKSAVPRIFVGVSWSTAFRMSLAVTCLVLAARRTPSVES
jgi:hypothetical protein